MYKPLPSLRSSARKGFTVLELLIVIAIIGLLASAITLSFRGITGRETLEKNAQTALSVFAKARFNALNGKAASAYGVQIASSSLTIFPGSSYSAGATSNEVVSLSGVTLDSVSLSGGGTAVTFSMLAGTTSKSGTFRMTGSSGTPKYFTIYNTGVVEVQ
jgi:prepilin-type N-terminal cleavage/methylation domain-containing protein